jgi:single-strand DNA-binding protein
MANLNKVYLMGNLTRDPQLRYLPSQTPVADFGIAVNRRWKTPQGEDREEVMFADCSAFAKQAELINQYCRKGSPLFIEGRLRFDQWEDKNGGGKRSKLAVVVENFQFIGSPGGGGGGGGPSAPPSDYDPATAGTPVQPRQPRATGTPGPAANPPAQAAPAAQQEPPISEEQHFKPDEIPF